MNDFDKVFSNDIEDEMNFDTLFNGDSDLIDIVGDKILESVDEELPEDLEDDDDEVEEECGSCKKEEANADPSEDGAEGQEPEKEETNIVHPVAAPTEKECGNTAPCNTADLDKVMSNDDSNDSVVAPPPVTAPPVQLPQNTADLDRAMNDTPAPKVIEEEEPSTETKPSTAAPSVPVVNNPEECSQCNEAEEITITAELDAMFEEYLEEGAKFSFLPRFKQYPELKEMYSTIEEAENLLNSEGEPTKDTANKFFKVALRVLDIYYNIGSVITLPMCLLIVPIIDHLIGRGIEYLIKYGEFAVAESSTKKVIEKLNKVKKETKDPKVKAKCEKQIKELSDKLHKMNKKEAVITTTAELDAMFESEIDTPEDTTDIDRTMLKDGEASVEDIKDLNKNDEISETRGELAVGEGTTAEFDNVINTLNDEDISPDSEGALDDGDDIDALSEGFELI